MIRTLFIILSVLYTANVFGGYGGYIGQTDNRRYGSLSDPEFYGIAKLSIDGGRCTGGFISKNLVLTNNHCAVSCAQGKQCSAEFWNGSAYEKSNLRIAAYYKEYKTLNGKDWAILISDKDNNFYRQILPKSTSGQVLRGGFGTLRIIKDNEIPYLKSLYLMVSKKYRQQCEEKSKTANENFVECINKIVNAELKKAGRKPLFGDRDNFKIQTCSVLGNHPKSNKMIKTDCDSAGGDSGAPLLRNGKIVGLNNSGAQYVFGNADANANAVKTENFYDYAQTYIKKYSNLASPQQPRKKNKTTTNKGGTNFVQSAISYQDTVQTQSDDDEQYIEQMLQQTFQEFDCD